MRPLTAVLAAVEEGVRSLDEVAERTGLSRSTVEAAVEQLGRMGRLDVHTLSIGCPDGGCGGCAAADHSTGAAGPAAPGCGATGATPARRGSAIVMIGLPKRHTWGADI